MRSEMNNLFPASDNLCDSMYRMVEQRNCSGDNCRGTWFTGPWDKVIIVLCGRNLHTSNRKISIFLLFSCLYIYFIFHEMNLFPFYFIVFFGFFS